MIFIFMRFLRNLSNLFPVKNTKNSKSYDINPLLLFANTPFNKDNCFHLPSVVLHLVLVDLDAHTLQDHLHRGLADGASSVLNILII